jgi:hypothetical protein
VDESLVAMEDGVDWEDYEYQDPKEQDEASQLLSFMRLLANYKVQISPAHLFMY